MNNYLRIFAWSYFLCFSVFMLLIIPHTNVADAQNPSIISEKRGSEEISEYYKPSDVWAAMAIIAIAVIGVFLYLARDIILRRKTEYEEKNLESKRDRDYEKYHSDWTTDNDDIFGEKKESKESKEFKKMLQESKFPNYYATLGVSPKSSPEEIKAKYRQLAKEYHPDITKDESTAETFAEITKAYDVLSDKEKKDAYDRYFRASID